jgi:thiamine pyrophosphate-dependent acetolactate synthase large subunit-like protein
MRGEIRQSRQMPLVSALEVVRDLRSDEIVVTSMGTAREWPALSQHARDLHYVPSAMGQAPLLGLGLALSQPDKQVIVFCGDGSLLMNLGCLVTIANAAPPNLVLLLFDNGVYEVTGGQRTAGGALERRSRRVEWTALAQSAGIDNVHAYADLTTWRAEAPRRLAEPGPCFIALSVAPMTGDTSVESPGPMAERLARFQAAIGVIQ